MPQKMLTGGGEGEGEGEGARAGAVRFGWIVGVCSVQRRPGVSTWWQGALGIHQGAGAGFAPSGCTSQSAVSPGLSLTLRGNDVRLPTLTSSATHSRNSMAP